MNIVHYRQKTGVGLMQWINAIMQVSDECAIARTSNKIVSRMWTDLCNWPDYRHTHPVN